MGVACGLAQMMGYVRGLSTIELKENLAMSDARFSRREMLLVAGATTLVSLTGCDHAASSRSQYLLIPLLVPRR
jgi:hypothetical protein